LVHDFEFELASLLLQVLGGLASFLVFQVLEHLGFALVHLDSLFYQLDSAAQDFDLVEPFCAIRHTAN
jgi:hypothetical protein